MKKYFVLITFVLLSLLFFSGVARADFAPTAVTSFDEESTWQVVNQKWQAVYRIKLVMTSDGSDPSSFALSDYISTAMLARIKGGALYRIVTAPGDVAPATAAFSIAFSGDLGEPWYTITTSTADTTAEKFSGGSEIVWDLNVDVGDFGDSTNILIIYLTIVR